MIFIRLLNKIDKRMKLYEIGKNIFFYSRDSKK